MGNNIFADKQYINDYECPRCHNIFPIYNRFKHDSRCTESNPLPLNKSRQIIVNNQNYSKKKSKDQYINDYECPRCHNIFPIYNRIMHDSRCTESNPLPLDKSRQIIVNNQNYIKKISKDAFEQKKEENIFFCEICGNFLPESEKIDHKLCHRLEEIENQQLQRQIDINRNINQTSQKNNENILEYKISNKEKINKINNLKKKLNEIEKKIIDIENYIKEKKIIIDNIKMEITKVNKELNNYSYNIIEINYLLNNLELKEKKLNGLEINIPLLLKPDEKLLSLIFISFDENIHYSIICKNTDIFSKIESLLYDKYPEYKKLDKSFIVNGKEININESLKNNKIKNSDIITLKLS